MQWRFEAESQTAPGPLDIRHNAQKYIDFMPTASLLMMMFSPRLTNAKTKVEYEGTKNSPPQKNINPRGQAWESASNAIQTQKRAPKITISKKQKWLWDILKNASKSRCEPEIPYHKLWPLIQIADLQLKTKNPKNSKPSPHLQPPFAIEDLGLQPTKGCSWIVLQKTNKLSLQTKTLNCKPPLCN